MFWMPEQRKTVILLSFLGYLCRHSTLLFVLLLPRLVLARFNELLLLLGVLEVLEHSEIMLSCVVLLLVFATSIKTIFAMYMMVISSFYDCRILLTWHSMNLMVQNHGF